MAVTKYKILAFDATKAQQGALCAVVLTSVNAGEELSTAEWTGTGENPLKGVSICRFSSPNNYTATIKSVTYTFNERGIAKNTTDTDYKLMLAETLDKASEIGSVVETDGTTGITRSADGSVTYTSEDDLSVVVSTLEARDQFAMQALKTLMERMDKDPSTISDNEMSFLCEQAYQWAANMMTQASKVRATVTTVGSGGSSGSGTTRSVDVDNSELTDTTDKLLNNIVSAIEKTDESEGTGDNIKYYERVSIPKLMTWLTAYSHHTATSTSDTQTTVGLDDLIKAIKAINVNLDTTDLVTAINSTHTNNIGNGGLGRDADHPIYINGGGGGFPSRQVLAAEFNATTLNDFLTFNAAGAVGYSTKAHAKEAILGYLNSYADISALATAVYNSLQITIDNRIKAWLQAAKVTVNGTDYSITVNTPT